VSRLPRDPRWALLGLEAPHPKWPCDPPSDSVAEGLFYALYLDGLSSNPVAGYLWALEADATAVTLALSACNADTHPQIMNRIRRAADGIVRKIRVALFLLEWLDAESKDGPFRGDPNAEDDEEDAPKAEAETVAPPAPEAKDGAS
jgi:hypothetical protein